MCVLCKVSSAIGPQKLLMEPGSTDPLITSEFVHLVNVCSLLNWWSVHSPTTTSPLSSQRHLLSAHQHALELLRLSGQHIHALEQQITYLRMHAGESNAKCGNLGSLSNPNSWEVNSDVYPYWWVISEWVALTYPNYLYSMTMTINQSILVYSFNLALTFIVMSSFVFFSFRDILHHLCNWRWKGTGGCGCICGIAFYGCINLYTCANVINTIYTRAGK